MYEISHSNIFTDTILTTKYLGVWNDNTNGYCPYGKDGSPINGPIAHYRVEFIDKNYEITPTQWENFYNHKRASKLNILRGRNHEDTLYTIYSPITNAQVKCWEALGEYLHDYAFSERLRLRDEQGLNWQTDWYISVDYIAAEQYVRAKINEVKHNGFYNDNEL